MKTALAIPLLASILLSVPLPLEARTFTDNEGRELEAELLAVEGETVRIRRGGRSSDEFELPLAKFSEEDQAFIRRWATERHAALAKHAPKPGEILSFEFPDLPNDFRGKPAAFKVKIPDSYDPAKPVPLLIFLGGGNGGNEPGPALSLTRGDFVCTSLPYPDDGRNPAQHNMVGDFDPVWKYWQPMLEKLEAAIPNLDPALRVIGGFSNGGHAIDGVLGEPGFASFFCAYFLVDGGGALPSRYRDVRDKHCYVAWGTKSPNAKNSEEVAERARRAGMIVVESPMQDVGHAFPESEKKKVIDWLYGTVIPAVGTGASR